LREIKKVSDDQPFTAVKDRELHKLSATSNHLSNTQCSKPYFMVMIHAIFQMNPKSIFEMGNELPSNERHVHVLTICDKKKFIMLTSLHGDNIMFVSYNGGH
jgi:hypothetical protein